ncbi:unnamed protein product, partial [Ectocarpus fasciculatus]
MARMEASLVQRPDPVVMEAHAEAYVMDRQFARAVRVYLSLAEHQAASENGRGGTRQQQQQQQQQRAGGVGRAPHGPARGRQGSSATSSITHGV